MTWQFIFLFEMKISAHYFKTPSKALSLKWNKKLKNVKSLSDKNAIIFLGEMLEILTGETANFHCTGIVDYDMFSSCDFQWQLRAGSAVIVRSLERSISDGLQRVEVYTDNVLIEGLSKYEFSWNGECGSSLSTMEVQIDIEDEKLVKKIVKIANALFEKSWQT